MLSKIRTRFALLHAIVLVFTTQMVFDANWAEASGSPYYLEGVGYREQALQ